MFSQQRHNVPSLNVWQSEIMYIMHDDEFVRTNFDLTNRQFTDTHTYINMQYKTLMFRALAPRHSYNENKLYVMWWWNKMKIPKVANSTPEKVMHYYHSRSIPPHRNKDNMENGYDETRAKGHKPHWRQAYISWKQNCVCHSNNCGHNIKRESHLACLSLMSFVDRRTQLLSPTQFSEMEMLCLWVKARKISQEWWSLQNCSSQKFTFL